NFMVERSGEHENEFDIKARAMMPLVDIARVLSLDHGWLEETNTMKRYAFLADSEPKKKELYLQAAEAYEYLMRFRAQHAFKYGGSGRYVSINKLNKLDRQILRNTFEPIDRLQKMLEVRYQLSYFQ
ncbi:MAG: putative nucleotidyltransferase substrate binding domain-containing protein, partial [Bacteroidota bacterium]